VGRGRLIGQSVGPTRAKPDGLTNHEVRVTVSGMPTAVFNGTTRPEWQTIALQVDDPPLRVTLSDSAGGRCAITFLMGSSQLSFIVKTERDVTDVGTFRNEVLSVVRPLFDLIGYLNGAVVRFEVDCVTFIEAENITLFLDAVPGIFDRQEDRPLGIGELFHIAVTNRNFARALADLRGSIEMFNDTAFYAFRAIENVMQFFSDESTNDRGSAWQRMRSMLRVDRDYVRPLENESKHARHGNPRFLTGIERVDLMMRAWRVVDRFAVLLSREAGEALPAAEFPTLK